MASPSTAVRLAHSEPTSVDLAGAEKALRDNLVELRETTPLSAFKLGTEEEGLDFDQIRYLRAVLPQDSEIFIKIGGPCAKADIRQAREVGAVGLVAPMVESVYGLRRFIEATEAIFGDNVRRAFNMETVTAYNSLDELLSSPWARKLDFLNIGRSDLAGSLDEDVDSDRMTTVVCDAIRRSHAAGLQVHVGGTVTVNTLKPVIEHIDFEGIHTRWLIFDMPGREATEDVVQRGLSFEVQMLRLLAARFPSLAADHLRRADITASRLQG